MVLHLDQDYIRDRARQYARLMRLHKPIGVLLLLWPMLWALWLAADGFPTPWVLAIFLVGSVLMRSAGCVINDYADRDFDGQVKRTQDRPLAMGTVSTTETLALFSALLLAAALLVLATNPLTVRLAVVGAVLAATYPFAKRYTYLPQLHLGVAFSWAIPMAFAAQTNQLPPLAWLVFCAGVLWAVIYDTEYAMVDRDDDIKLGVKSTAILFDDADRLAIGLLQVLMLFNLTFIGHQAGLRWPYYLAVFAVLGLFTFQQHKIFKRDRDGCFGAFANNNWVGGVVFAGIFASYHLPV